MYCVVKRRAKSAYCQALSDGTLLLDNYAVDKVRVIANRPFEYIGFKYKKDELKGMELTIAQKNIATGWKQASKYVKDKTYV